MNTRKIIWEAMKEYILVKLDTNKKNMKDLSKYQSKHMIS